MMDKLVAGEPAKINQPKPPEVSENVYFKTDNGFGFAYTDSGKPQAPEGATEMKKSEHDKLVAANEKAMMKAASGQEKK